MTRAEDLTFEQLARDFQIANRAFQVERDFSHGLAHFLIEKGHLDDLVNYLLLLFHNGQIGWKTVQHYSHLSDEELDKRQELLDNTDQGWRYPYLIPKLRRGETDCCQVQAAK